MRNGWKSTLDRVFPFKIKPEEALVVTINGKNQIFCQKKEGKTR